MKNITITFSNEQLQTLNDAIIELPYKKAYPLITHINAELQKLHDSSADQRDEQVGSNQRTEP